MKIASKVLVGLLTFLAVSSGMTKAMLVERDVDFFGAYGFTNPMIVVFGLVQLLGGVLLLFGKTRAVGAGIVAVTFMVSMCVLVMDGNIPVAIVSGVATVLLAVVVKQNWKRDG